jgi:ubiquinone/menaquinone biosynthesis C-methylase UbiE
VAIDQTSDPRYYIRFMDIVRKGNDSDPEQYRPIFELLAAREGETMLDIGCGTGGAVRALAPQVGSSGCVVGIDYSTTMLAEAEQRAAGLNLPIEYRLADAQALPFEDNTFDGCYATGVFEILPDPRQALAEMVRVTRPGGRLVVFGQDADGAVIDAEDRTVTRKFLHFVCDHELNGWIGRQLPGYAHELGLLDVNVVPAPSLVTDFSFIYDLLLCQLLESAQDAGVLSMTEVDAWVADQQARQQAGRCFICWGGFLVFARKPASDADLKGEQ